MNWLAWFLNHQQYLPNLQVVYLPYQPVNAGLLNHQPNYRCHMWVPLEPLEPSRLHPHLLLTGGGWIRWGFAGVEAHDGSCVVGCRFSAYGWCDFSKRWNLSDSWWLIDFDGWFFCGLRRLHCCFVKLCLLLVDCWLLVVVAVATSWQACCQRSRPGRSHGEERIQ